MTGWGKCHLCQQHEVVTYCRDCQHWFCETCRRRYFKRGLAAVLQMVKGRRKGCCGIMEW